MVPIFGFDCLPDPPKRAKTIRSAFQSETFDADVSIHVNAAVGAATISPSGRDVAIASAEGLSIIDLDSPYSPPRRLSSHGLPWLVVDIQWSPHAVRDYWVVSTANHRCLVWNLNLSDESSSGAIEHVLQGHDRAITDVHFHAFHPDILATCAVDGFVHWWDLRRPRQPVLTFSDWFAGATQVKFNRQDSHLLASSHDRWLHVWDDRKTAEPLKTIAAHTTKIYGVDWDRNHKETLATCSLDKTIKLWDWAADGQELQRIIRTDFPIWRARYTPFGTGLMVMPQNEPGHLYLYHLHHKPGAPIDAFADPVAIFLSHNNFKSREFLWRSRGGISNDRIDDREFQLVSWGEDKELRLRKIDSHILEAAGHVRGAKADPNTRLTRKGATYKTFRTVDDSTRFDRRSATMSAPREDRSGYSRRSTGIGLLDPQHKPSPRSGNWRGNRLKAKVGRRDQDADRSQLQLGWMKGISVVRRKPIDGVPDDGALKHSGLFSPTYPGWAEPETIQEEIVRISNQLRNVKWENIDMDSLTMSASLQGPWGDNRASIFIQVRVDIPTNYPKAKSPSFFLDNSFSMSEETQRRVENELRIIAGQFLERKQNCLEVIFSYLLGEIDLESSTTLFRNDRDLDDEPFALAEESSSEDNGPELGLGKAMSLDLGLEDSTELDPLGALGPAHRLAVPLVPTRTCGCRFANDGRLVCFFPTKEEKTKALSSTTGADSSNRERPKGEHNFAGFGRLTHASLLLRRSFRDDASGSEDHSVASEDFDSSDEDSADSGSSTDSELMNKVKFWYQPRRRVRKTWSANESARSSGGGTGAGTGTGTGTGTGGASRRRHAKPRNLVSIHDLRDALPSKKQFAQEYIIFGDGTQVCSHNAAVASRHGFSDIANIWKYAALLLRKSIPLELYESHRPLGSESILVIARDAVARWPADDDQEVADLDNHAAPVAHLSGRVRWGCHPLARVFIDELFDYFETISDVQMLAMLSCIFGGSSTDDHLALASALSRLKLTETPLPLKAPSFSLDYFPSDPDSWNFNIKSQGSSDNTTPRTTHTPAMYSDSLGSQDGVSLLESMVSPRSADDSLAKVPGRVHEHGTLPGVEDLTNHQTHSLSSSPGKSRLFQRSNSAVAAALAISLPRTLAGMMSGSVSGSVSGSPPRTLPLSRKRPSPASGENPSITGGAATVMGVGGQSQTVDPFKVAPGTGTAQTSTSDEDFLPRGQGRGNRPDADEDFTDMVPVAVSCVAENQGLFDDDGWMSRPFLDDGSDPGHNNRYSQYRYAYSEMLHMWDQPLARLEILKFNVLRGGEKDGEEDAGSADVNEDVVANTIRNRGHGASDISPRHHPGDKKAAIKPLALTRRNRLQALLASGSGLNVTGICRIHEIQLDPLEYSQSTGGTAGGAVGICPRCNAERWPAKGSTDPVSASATAASDSPRQRPAKRPESESSSFQEEVTILYTEFISDDSPTPSAPSSAPTVPPRKQAAARMSVPSTMAAPQFGATTVPPQRQLRCVLCTEPVYALYPACLGCGCVLHETCLAEWNAVGEIECPAGDECECVAEASSGQVESWLALQAAVANTTKKRFSYLYGAGARPAMYQGGFGAALGGGRLNHPFGAAAAGSNGGAERRAGRVATFGDEARTPTSRELSGKGALLFAAGPGARSGTSAARPLRRSIPTRVTGPSGAVGADGGGGDDDDDDHHHHHHHHHYAGNRTTDDKNSVARTTRFHRTNRPNVNNSSSYNNNRNIFGARADSSTSEDYESEYGYTVVQEDTGEDDSGSEEKDGGRSAADIWRARARSSSRRPPRQQHIAFAPAAAAAAAAAPGRSRRKSNASVAKAGPPPEASGKSGLSDAQLALQKVATAGEFEASARKGGGGGGGGSTGLAGPSNPPKPEMLRRNKTAVSLPQVWRKKGGGGGAAEGGGGGEGGRGAEGASG